MLDHTTKLNVERVTLERMKNVSRVALPRDAKFELIEDIGYFADQLILQLEAYIAANKIHESEWIDKDKQVTRVETVPANWWAHIKQRLLERWPKIFKGRIQWEARQIPVEHITDIKHVTVYHMCPHLDIPPRDRLHIDFMMMKVENCNKCE